MPWLQRPQEVLSVASASSAPAPSRVRFITPDKRRETVNHICAGVFARTTAQLFVHPIDTVKTRLQVSKPVKKLKKWRKKLTKKKHTYTLRWQEKKLRMQNWLFKGPRDAYMGLTGAILGTLPTALVNFVVFEAVKRQLGAHLDEDDPLVHLGSAGAGAVTSAFVRVPGDTVKHQVQAYLHKDVFAAARHIWRHNGPAGLYKGFAPTVMRDVPDIALQFYCYEWLRRIVGQEVGKEKLKTWQHLALGGLSGAVAAAVTMPLDCVKTKLQCGASQPLPQLVGSVVRTEGVGGLYRGIGPRTFHASLMSAVFFTLYEYGKLLLKPKEKRSETDQLLLPKLINKRRDKVWKRGLVVE
mmetsp:Transcript_28011/g.95497  ORF Transcript_28011/g.95497 Transcript_28011/m.95497 type:complete len:354 (-) Transcript_28011:425-1486(-)